MPESTALIQDLFLLQHAFPALLVHIAPWLAQAASTAAPPVLMADIPPRRAPRPCRRAPTFRPTDARRTATAITPRATRCRGHGPAISWGPLYKAPPPGPAAGASSPGCARTATLAPTREGHATVPASWGRARTRCSRARSGTTAGPPASRVPRGPTCRRRGSGSPAATRVPWGRSPTQQERACCPTAKTAVSDHTQPFRARLRRTTA
mmetsp:Transcript_13361/g.36945  ORF Transcript_13361/g.36945 Transcript_13361/m.36945 type:complete len:208 (-) Transcript_13361:491-1114(-)